VFDAEAELDEPTLTTLLNAARWAPSAGNTQPWRFVVLRRGSPGHAALVEHLSRGNSGWVPTASVVFLAAAQMEADPAEGPEARQPNQDYARYDLGQAAAHLTLQARAMGLHAHQFAGFDHEGTAEALGVPAHVRVFSGIAVGVKGDPTHAAERDAEREQRPRVRRDLADVVHDDAWGRAWEEA